MLCLHPGSCGCGGAPERHPAARIANWPGAVSGANSCKREADFCRCMKNCPPKVMKRPQGSTGALLKLRRPKGPLRGFGPRPAARFPWWKMSSPCTQFTVRKAALSRPEMPTRSLDWNQKIHPKNKEERRLFRVKQDCKRAQGASMSRWKNWCFSNFWPIFTMWSSSRRVLGRNFRAMGSLRSIGESLDSSTSVRESSSFLAEHSGGSNAPCFPPLNHTPSKPPKTPQIQQTPNPKSPKHPKKEKQKHTKKKKKHLKP